MSYERDNIARMHGYVPGEQPADVAGVVKLNTNENPYPPADAVMQAIGNISADRLRRYPPPDAAAFRQLAARVHDVAPEQVIATNGGDELLRLAVTVFCRSGGRSATDRQPEGSDAAAVGIGIAEPTYSLYRVLGDIHDTAAITAPLTDAYALPIDFADRMADAGVGLVLIVNPHAPSGRLEPLDLLEQIARRLRGRAVLLIDEAYADFADRDALPLVRPEADLDNVLILRTLSKGYSLAGLRFGYGIGHRHLIAALDKARDSYNTDIVSQVAAVAALEQREQATRTWGKVRAERQRLTEALAARGWAVLPSQTNFVLATPAAVADAPADATPARFVYESLKRRHILVRYFDQAALRDKLRITVGTPQQTDALLAAIDAMTGSVSPV